MLPIRRKLISHNFPPSLPTLSCLDYKAQCKKNKKKIDDAVSVSDKNLKQNSFSFKFKRDTKTLL
jgi:hypothetical protein